MTIEMVLPLLRIKLQSPLECAGASPEGVPDSKETEFGIEKISLTSQLAGRMAVRVRDEGEPVQGRDTAVHIRVGGQACFQRKYIRTEIPEALLHRIKT